MKGQRFSSGREEEKYLLKSNCERRVRRTFRQKQGHGFPEVKRRGPGRGRRTNGWGLMDGGRV